MHAADRPPSSNWEAIPLADDPPGFVWAWFKPPAAPQGLAIRIPGETFKIRRRPITVRALLAALAIEPSRLLGWSLSGATFECRGGTNPALDYPLPDPDSLADATIALFLQAGSPQFAAPMPPAGGAPAEAGTDLLARMDADWHAAIQLETQLAAAAKQLSATLGRINALNRDLSFDEGRNADQLDKRDWHEARRWLRDVATRVARFLKDQHTGLTSSAGKRNTIEGIHRQFVTARRPFDGMEQTSRDFEWYRKALQTLLNHMSAAQAAAVQDGERRAQQVLVRIQSKMRSNRAKR